jgi:hypothetical protein
MKSKPLHKTLTWIDMGCFPGTCLLSSGHDYDSLKGELEKLEAANWFTPLSRIKSDINNPEISGSAFRKLFKRKGQSSVVFYYLIMKDPFDFSDQAYITLAHECLHIVQYVLVPILNRDNEAEAEAYLHSHLMAQCLSALRGN